MGNKDWQKTAIRGILTQIGLGTDGAQHRLDRLCNGRLDRLYRFADWLCTSPGTLLASNKQASTQKYAEDSPKATETHRLQLMSDLLMQTSRKHRFQANKQANKQKNFFWDAEQRQWAQTQGNVPICYQLVVTYLKCDLLQIARSGPAVKITTIEYLR